MHKAQAQRIWQKGFKDANSYDKSLIKKLSITYKLDDKEKQAFYSILDALCKINLLRNNPRCPYCKEAHERHSLIGYWAGLLIQNPGVDAPGLG